MNDKIVIGTKGKSDSGYVFYPYIKVFELKLPLKFEKLDSKGNPIFTKIESYEFTRKD
jgi:hypothetical protein